MSSLSGAKAAINPTVPAAAVTAAPAGAGPPPAAAATPASEQPKRKTGGSGPSRAAAKPPLVVPTIQHKHNDEEGDELTRRLQKLALERQKESKNERLRVIQNDPSQTHLTSAKTFQELNLPTHLMDAIFAMGFDRPSAIQEEALPRILANPPHNLIGQAQSGSGKTVAFTLGMLYRIVIDHPATTQALCVSPTRELAIQIVDQAVRPMAANMTGLKIELAVAGVKTTTRSIDAHIVVGTPGKVVDWIKRKYINAKTIKVFVLDEADNMVDEEAHRASSVLIKKHLSPMCQSLLFSATFPDNVVAFASKLVERPDKILIEQGPDALILKVIQQLWVDTRSYPGGKLEFLADIYSLCSIAQSIIFVETVRSADQVHAAMTNAGYACSVLHGRVEGVDRDTTMEDFRLGKSKVLITTNVLARGVNVDNVDVVINYDPPVDKKRNPDFETYLHRIGRTGRFGSKGTAISLIDDEDSLQVVAAIERHFANGEEMIKQVAADPEKLAEMVIKHQYQ